MVSASEALSLLQMAANSEHFPVRVLGAVGGQKTAPSPTLHVCQTVQCWVCRLNTGLCSSSHSDSEGSRRLAQMWVVIQLF